MGRFEQKFGNTGFLSTLVFHIQRGKRPIANRGNAIWTPKETESTHESS